MSGMDPTQDVIALQLAFEWEIDPTPENLARIRKSFAYATRALDANLRELGRAIADPIVTWCVPAGAVAGAFNRGDHA